MNPRCCLLLALAVLVPVSPCLADDWVYEALLASSVQTEHGSIHFGEAVAVDRNPDGSIRALYVGLPDADVIYGGLVYVRAGKVEVWQPQGGWHKAATINGEPDTEARFGASLSVHRGAIAVGAPGATLGRGRVWVYEDRNSQLPGQPALDIQPVISGFVGVAVDDHMGKSVAIHGDGLKPGGDGSFLIAGAPAHDGNSGCVYTAKLRRDIANPAISSYCTTAAQANLGWSVAIHATGADEFRAVAGTPSRTTQGVVAGGARTFFGSGSSLSLEQTISPSDPVVLDAFGLSVAMDAHRIYIGGPSRTRSGGVRTGSVTVFVRWPLDWRLDTELFPAGGNADNCGWSVGAEPDGTVGRVAIGCPRYDGAHADQGALRVFERAADGSGWSQERADVGDDPYSGSDLLGTSVALTANRVIGGAPKALAPLSTNDEAGVVHAFLRDVIFRDGFE